MERRREPRFKISGTVALRVLGPMEEPGLGNLINAQVLDMSGSGMRLSLPLPVPCGAPVEITSPHSLILGEVCRCAPENGGYTVGVRAFQHLPSSLETSRKNIIRLEHNHPPRT